MLQALINFIDAENTAAASEPDPCESQTPQTSPPQRAPSADDLAAKARLHRTPRQVELDAVNELVAAVLVDITEKRFRSAREGLTALESACATSASIIDSATGGTTSSSTFIQQGRTRDDSTCPHCSRRVASLAMHIRTCPAAPPPGGAAATAVEAPPPPKVVPPMLEIVASLRSKLADAVIAEMHSPATPVDEMRSLWCDGAALGDPRASAVFGDTVTAHFTQFAEGVRGEMNALRSLMRVGVDSSSGTASDSSGVPLHPYLRRHRAALGAGPVNADGSLALRGDGRPAPSPPPSAAAATPEAAVDALASLLGEASSWLIDIMETRGGAPHAERCAIAARVHSSATAAALPVLALFAADTHLSTTIALARAAADVAEGRPPVLWPRSSSGDGDADKHVALQQQRQQQSSQRLAAWRDGPPSGVWLVPGGIALAAEWPLPAQPPPAAATSSSRIAAGANTRPAQPPPPLVIALSAAVAIVDEAADIVSFICQLLERYLRSVSAALSLGPRGAPSRLPDSDALTAAMHALQSQYVALEHAYVAHSIASVLADNTSWERVSVHEDAAVKTHAWCDAVFFVASKGLARSGATCCDMAAAAALNYVTGCLDGAVRVAVRRCAQAATDTVSSANPPHGGGSAARATYGRGTAAKDNENEDDIDAALARRFAQALLGPGSTRPSVDAPRTLHSAPTATAAHPRAVKDACLAADSAIVGLNTIATTARYASSLYHRALTEMTGLFPAQATATSMTTAIATKAMRLGEPQYAAAVNHISQNSLNAAVVRAELELVQTVLHGPLSELRAVTQSFDAVVSAAARAMARTIAASGVAVITRFSEVDPMAYALDDARFLAVTDGVGGPVPVDPARAVAATTHKGAGTAAVSLGDPVVAAIAHDVIASPGLPALLSRLLAPDAAAPLLVGVASAVAEALENGWARAAAVTDLGALRMQAQARAAHGLFDRLTWASVWRDERTQQHFSSRGEGIGIRAAFGRLTVLAEVYGVDSVDALYAVPQPLHPLSRSDVSSALERRVVLVLRAGPDAATAASPGVPAVGQWLPLFSPATIQTLDWQRVKVTCEADVRVGAST